MRGRRRVAHLLGALAFSLFFWGRMLTFDPTVVHGITFGSDAPSWLALSAEGSHGWRPGQPFPTAPGETSHVIIDLSLPPETRLTAEVTTGWSSVRMRPLSRNEDEQREAVIPLRRGRQAIDLTPHVPHSGLLRIALEAASPVPPPPEPAVSEGRFTLEFPRRLHWGPLVFFFVTGALVWVGLPLLLAAEWRETGLGLRPPWVMAALGLVGILLLLPGHSWPEGRQPLLTGRKLFDDVRALSNAALMVANGGDTAQLYFRSRERPGYLAHAIPLTLLFPQQLIRAQFAPSDFRAQMWREFDRRGATFGSFRQVEISAVAWLEGLVCALVWAMIWRRLGCGAAAAWLAAVLAAALFARVLYNPLTLIWNLLINAAAVLATLRLLDRPGPERALLAGATLGLAALTKATAITSILPLTVLWLGRGTHRSGAPLWRWTLAAVALAAALVLWWFEGLMGGLITERAVTRPTSPASSPSTPSSRAGRGTRSCARSGPSRGRGGFSSRSALRWGGGAPRWPRPISHRLRPGPSPPPRGPSPGSGPWRGCSPSPCRSCSRASSSTWRRASGFWAPRASSLSQGRGDAESPPDRSARFTLPSRSRLCAGRCRPASHRARGRTGSPDSPRTSAARPRCGAPAHADPRPPRR